MNELEVFSIGRDEAGPVRAGGECDKNIEVKIAQFGRCEAVIDLH